MQFNSAFNLACRLKREASHLVLGKNNHPSTAKMILSVRDNVPVLPSDFQQKRLSGGSPPGWSLGGLAQLAERSTSAAGLALPGASGCDLGWLRFLPGSVQRLFGPSRALQCSLALLAEF